MSDKKRPMTLEDFLSTFAIVNYGGRTRVVELESPDRIKPGTIREIRDFRLFYDHLQCTIEQKVRDKDGKVKVNGDGIEIVKITTKKLVDHFLSHPARKVYDRVVYDMPGGPPESKAGPHDFNAYQGLTVVPKVGDWSLSKRHIWEIICDEDDDLFHWVFNWLAAMFQKPGRHAWAALVLIGEKGTGKSHFVDYMLGLCFHRQQYALINGVGQLTEKFNEILSGKVLVFADESTWGGDKRHEGRLKGLLTESHISIERKFLPPVPEPSSLHVIFSSNEMWPVPTSGNKERRFLMLKVRETYRQNDAYFAALRKEFENGGRAAMIEELLAWQVDEALLRHPIITQTQKEMSVNSWSSVEDWWCEVLHKGLLGDAKMWQRQVPKNVITESYRRYAQDEHERSLRGTEMKIASFLQSFTFEDTRLRAGGERSRFWEFPTLRECRRLWTERYGLPSANDWQTYDDEDPVTPDDAHPMLRAARNRSDDDEL